MHSLQRRIDSKKNPSANAENSQNRAATKHFSIKVVVLFNTTGSVLVRTVYPRLKTLCSPQQKILGCRLEP